MAQATLNATNSTLVMRKTNVGIPYNSSHVGLLQADNSNDAGRLLRNPGPLARIIPPGNKLDEADSRKDYLPAGPL
jgi:hypothetical protein